MENLAHELRTHLAILKTNAEVACMDPTLTPSVHEALQQVLIEVDELSSLASRVSSNN
jgi:signal transduction histidine kinase